MSSTYLNYSTNSTYLNRSTSSTYSLISTYSTNSTKRADNNSHIEKYFMKLEKNSLTLHEHNLCNSLI